MPTTVFSWTASAPVRSVCSSWGACRSLLSKSSVLSHTFDQARIWCQAPAALGALSRRKKCKRKKDFCAGLCAMAGRGAPGARRGAAGAWG